jgi:hypothetical protein
MSLPNRAVTSAWVWVALLVLGGSSQLAHHGWHFIDLPNLLASAEELNLKETIIEAFVGPVEYRPLLKIAIEVLYSLVGTNIIVYKVITIAQYAAILCCFVLMFRIRTMPQALATCLALSCFAGMPSASILFNFYPVNVHSLSLLLILTTIALALSPHRRYYPACYFVLALSAPLCIELGVLIPGVVLSLWWTRAPGLNARSVAWGLCGFGLYVATRLAFSGADGALPWFHNESGVGFHTLYPDELANAFGAAPYLFWVYNAGTGLLSTLFSEPIAGHFQFIHSLIVDDTQPWQWIQVTTSVCTTMVAVWALARFSWTEHQRQLVVLGTVLLLSGSALGFLYARERVLLGASVGYAVLVFVAASAMTAPSAPGRKGPLRSVGRIGAVGLILLALVAWTWRSGGVLFEVRDRAFENYRDWGTRYDADHNAGSVELRASLRSTSLATQPPDPFCDPDWTKRYFFRRYSYDTDADRDIRVAQCTATATRAP